MPFVPPDFDDKDAVVISDVLGFWDMVNLLKPRLPEFSESKIVSGLRRYLSGEDTTSWFYTREQALDAAQKLMDGFVEDCLAPVNDDGFVEQVTFAGQVAKETGLVLVGEPAFTCFYRAIDGRW
ncbi:MAG: hypothetical protein SNJ57_09280 [Cyanobacteriota bacterium]